MAAVRPDAGTARTGQERSGQGRGSGFQEGLVERRRDADRLAVLGMTARQVTWLIALAISVVAHADGPAGYRTRPDSPAAISGQDAVDAYNAGYASILRAEHQDDLAAASTTAPEREAATRAARSSYEEALGHFASAVRFDVSMHEAYTYMGYANRKLGRHEKALAA